MIAYIVIGFVVALIFFNVYFRAKILKIYKTLIANKIEFGLVHILNKRRLENEVLTKYPKFINEINTFVSSIRLSFIIAVTLLLGITLIGIIIK
jgi:hypothetical protein